jgi:membrane protein involved in colicin uptake
MTEKTAEQIAAEKAAAEQAKAEAKAKKEAEKSEAKAKREAEAADKKAAKEAEKAQKKADAEAKKAAEKAAKEQAKIDAKAARDANRMPEQNGIRRPKPDTLCGKAWGIFDSVSQKHGAPASIGESMELAKADGLNEANVRAEYARWRKFHGITGRIESPKAETTSAGAEQA